MPSRAVHQMPTGDEVPLFVAERRSISFSWELLTTAVILRSDFRCSCVLPESRTQLARRLFFCRIEQALSEKPLFYLKAD